MVSHGCLIGMGVCGAVIMFCTRRLRVVRSHCNWPDALHSQELLLLLDSHQARHKGDHENHDITYGWGHQDSAHPSSLHAISVQVCKSILINEAQHWLLAICLPAIPSHFLCSIPLFFFCSIPLFFFALFLYFSLLSSSIFLCSIPLFSLECLCIPSFHSFRHILSETWTWYGMSTGS